jgi:hypothetical protein
MAKAPKDAKEKYDAVMDAWENLAPTAQFGGMTLEQFQLVIKPSDEARAKISTLDQQMTAALNARTTADVVSLEKVQMVVNGVVGDPNFGPDSALYEAMGYIRKSERKSGLTRKKSNGT